MTRRRRCGRHEREVGEQNPAEIAIRLKRGEFQRLASETRVPPGLAWRVASDPWPPYLYRDGRHHLHINIAEHGTSADGFDCIQVSNNLRRAFERILRFQG